MTAGLPLMKNLVTPLAKSILLPLRLKAAASTTDAAVWKNKKEQKGRFVGMLLGRLAANLLGNILACEGVIKGGVRVVWESKPTNWAGQNF